MSGAVRGLLTLGWTAVGMSDILSYYRIQTENIKHFEYRVVSECIVRMLSDG